MASGDGFDTSDGQAGEDPQEERAPSRALQRTESLPRSRRTDISLDDLDAPSFPLALRGYERDAVDRHVTRLRQRIAELEAVRTPEAVMRRALEQVGEETSGILRQAQDTAADMAARSRAQADDRLERARRDADEIRVSAEMRLRQLDADADVVWRERAALIDDVRKVAAELLEVIERADKRHPPADESGTGRTGSFEAVVLEEDTTQADAAPQAAEERGVLLEDAEAAEAAENIRSVPETAGPDAEAEREGRPPES